MRPWLYVIAWEGLWHMPDTCYKCKVEQHGECIPTQVGAGCNCKRGKCKTATKPSGGGFEKKKSSRASLRARSGQQARLYSS